MLSQVKCATSACQHREEVTRNNGAFDSVPSPGLMLSQRWPFSLQVSQPDPACRQSRLSALPWASSRWWEAGVGGEEEHVMPAHASL